MSFTPLLANSLQKARNFFLFLIVIPVVLSSKGYVLIEKIIFSVFLLSSAQVWKYLVVREDSLTFVQTLSQRLNMMIKFIFSLLAIIFFNINLLIFS
jgi:hypothetical protein